MAFDRARYLESIQQKYGASQNIINSNTNTSNNGGVNTYTSLFNNYQYGNVLRTINSTLSEFTSDATKGFLGSIEGIVDLGASAVGLVGGFIDKDFKDAVSDFVAHDYSAEQYDNWVKYLDVHQLINMAIEGDINADAREYSAYQYLGETGQNIAHGVGEAGGQFLFALATSGIGGAVGLGAKAINVLQGASIFTSASGRGIESGLNEGLGLEKATAYGLASGAIELATERIVGGAVGKLTGQTGVLDKGISKVLNKVVKGSTTGSVITKQLLKLGFDTIGEGFEEVASDILDQKVVRPLMGLESNLTASDIGQSFLIGMMSSALFNGIVETGNFAQGKTSYATQIISNEMQNNIDETIGKIKDIEKRFKLDLQRFADKESLEQAKQKAIEEVEQEFLEKNDNLVNQLNQVLEEGGIDENIVVKSGNEQNVVYNENVATQQKIPNQSVTVAPYTIVKITKDNYQSYKNNVKKPFFDKANQIAKELGIEIELFSDNIGGYEFTQGDFKGEKVTEISWSFDIKNASAEQADTFAMLLGDLGYEVQEAVISANYVANDSYDANALETRISYRDLSWNEVVSFLHKLNIINFTIDKTRNEIRLLDLSNNEGKIDIDDTRNIKLIELLGEHYYGIEQSKINSRYLDSETRENVYRGWIETTEISGQNGTSVRLHTIKEAYERVRNFNQKRHTTEIIKKQKDIDTNVYKALQSYYDVKKYNKTDIENIYKSTRDLMDFYLRNTITKGASEKNIDKTYSKIKKATLNQSINENNVNSVSEIFANEILQDIQVDGISLEDYLDDVDYENIKDSLVNDFRDLFLNKGDISGKVNDLKNSINKLNDKLKTQKEKYKGLKDKAKALIQLERTEKSTKRKADIRKNNRVGANIPPHFAEAYKILFDRGNMVSSTKLSVSERDKQMRERAKKYRDDFYNEEKLTELNIAYNEEIGAMLDEIVNGEGDLSTQEIFNLRKIIRNLNSIVDNYNKVRIKGKMVELRDIGERQSKDIDNYLGKKQSKWGVEKNKISLMFRRANRFFSTPYYVFQSFDLGNPEGALSQILVDKINNGEIQSDEMLKEVIEYKNKYISNNYIKGLKKEIEIEVDGVKYKIDKGTLLSMYMGLQRDWAMEHYKTTKIIEFEDLKGVKHQIKGFDEKLLVNLEQQGAITAEDIEASKHLLHLYKIMAKYKETTDIQISGFSNIETDGVYYPIQTRSSARPQNVDSSMQSMMKNLIRGFGFNKRTLSSKGSLFFDNCFETLNTYITNMGRYVAYGDAISSTNRYLNTNITGDTNNPRYMKDVYLEKVDSKFMEYLTDYFQDIQGLKTGKKDVAWLSKIRSNFSKAVLYANPKVVIQQLSAIGSFLTHTSLPNLSKAVAQVMVNPVKAIKRMKDNSASAYIRYDGTQIVDNMINATDTSKKNAVMRKIDTIGGWGISFMDRFALAIGYQACINQANGNVDEGNLLFEDAVRVSQPSVSTSGMSQARRGSEFSKTISMFTSQTQQNTTMILSALLELQYANRMLKLAKEGKVELEHDVKYYEEIKSKATKKMRKFTTAYFAQATMVTLIAVALNYALGNNDDEDEKLISIFGKGFIENTIGSWNPIVNAVVSQLVNNGKYDFQLNTITAINDVFDSMMNTIEIGKKLMTKEEIKSSDITSVLLGVSKIAGIPTANVIKYGNWVVSWFSPETALKMNNALYGASASKSTQTLNRYIEEGKDDIAKNELKYIMATYKTGATSDYANDELYRLYKSGYDVLPSSLMSTLSINEEEYNMNNKANKSKFMSVYSKANSLIEELLKSSQYKSLNDSGKAQAIKRIYTSYYNLSKFVLTNENYALDRKFDKLAKLFVNKGKEANILTKLSSHLSKIDEMEDDKKKSRKEKVQKYINSLSLSKNEKYLLYYLAGYSLSEEQKKLVENYLRNKGASSTEIKEFF